MAMTRYHDMLSVLTMMAGYPAGTVFFARGQPESARSRISGCARHLPENGDFKRALANPGGLLIEPDDLGRACWTCEVERLPDGTHDQGDRVVVKQGGSVVIMGVW